MVRFFLSLPRPDGISARDSWETRGMRRSRLCVFFLSSLLAGGRGNRRSLREREREIFFCARKGGNLALVVFFRLGANDARAIFEEICVLWIFVRAKRVEFVRERRSDGWFLSAFTNRQKGRRGSRVAGFSLFFLLLVSFTSHSHENFSFSKNLQPSQKTFKIKKILGKKQKQNRPIPQWIRMKTGNTIRYNAKRRHWRRTKLNI
jgi:large subunit ribosomal protein L39e